MISFLLAHGAELKSIEKGEHGPFPAHVATANGHAEMLSLLLAKMASTNVRDSDGVQPLHLAAQYGHFDALPELVKHRATIDAQDAGGATPLHWASYNGHAQVLVWLLKHGAKVHSSDESGQQAAHVAAKAGHAAALSSLIAGPVSASCKELAMSTLDAKGASGQRPLHIAAEEGHIDVIKWLDEQGAPPLDATASSQIGHAAVRRWFAEGRTRRQLGGEL